MTYQRESFSTTRATIQAPTKRPITYVESNIQDMRKEDGPTTDGHTLPPVEDPADDSGYDPFADGDGSEVNGDYAGGEGDPADEPPPGLTTGAKVLIGAAALGGIFLIIRAMR